MNNNVIDLVERYGRVRFSKRIAQLEDEEAEELYYEWLDQQRCSFCGGDPYLLNWGDEKKHYCYDCAHKSGLLAQDLKELL